MNTQEIEKLILLGESETLEFKTSTAQLKPAFKTACAFLNGEGGTVLIGVNQDGKSVGQSVTDKTRKEIAAELSKIEPNPPIAVHYIELEQQSKWIIALNAPKTDFAPYLYDGRAYQRHQSSTVRMPQQYYEQRLINRESLNYSWEKALIKDYEVSDLDHEEIHRTIAYGIQENRIPSIAQGEAIEMLLQRLDLISDGQLRRAAIVLYAKSPSLHLTQCAIKMARFSGTDKLGTYIDNKYVHGNAFGILSEAESFLRKHLSIASFFKSDQFQRIDKPTLPVIAVREALINAICHRDYAQHAIDITLAVFDDRVEIWNSGELPSILKIADLKKTHPSIPRNPIIAKSFYIRGFIEAWGTGTNKMVALCRELDVPVPIFKQHFGGILVVLRFKEPLSTVSELSKFNLHTLSKRQIEILTVLISQGSEWVDHTTIYDGLIQPPARRTLQLDLRKLKEKGWLRMRGHAYSAQWGLIDNKKHKEEILKQLTQPGAT